MKYILFVALLFASASYGDTYYSFNKNNQPYDYSIKSQSPSQSMADGFNSGIKMGQMLEQGKQQREIREANAQKSERQLAYRVELKKFYDHPETLNDENLMKLMILYPEFQDTTEKIQNSYHKISNKQQN